MSKVFCICLNNGTIIAGKETEESTVIKNPFLLGFNPQVNSWMLAPFAGNFCKEKLFIDPQAITMSFEGDKDLENMYSKAVAESNAAKSGIVLVK